MSTMSVMLTKSPYWARVAVMSVVVMLEPDGVTPSARAVVASGKFS